MKKNKTIRIVSIGVGLTFAVGACSTLLSACKDQGINNETTPLVVSTDVLDGVFNPFFYTSGPDGDVVNQTQIGLLSSDENGQPVAGKDEPCVALAYSVKTEGTSADQKPGTDHEYDNYYTDYYFALKDDIVFSDGVPLTYKDVLFNMYVYLDPVYTGSSTMYSVDIQGLAAYRTQTEDKNQQEQFEGKFDTLAQNRIGALRDWAENDEEGDADLLTEEQQKDLDKVHELFLEELKTDWTSAQSADMEEYQKYGFKENWEVFLYNYGVIEVRTVRTPNGEGGYNVKYEVERNYDDKMAKDEETLTQYVYTYMLGGRDSASEKYKENLVNVILYYGTANTFRQYLVSDEISKEFGSNQPVRKVKGIEILEDQTSIPVGSQGNGGDLNGTYDVLHIRINGEDPKAIQNFSFTVAPMHYYAPDYVDDFTMEEGKEFFGVPFANSDFMTSIRVNQVPLGAGPYRATTENGSSPTDKIEKGDFYNNSFVFMERNESFLLGAPKIKYLRYQVIYNSLLYDAALTGTVHYASPSVDADVYSDLTNDDKDVLDYVITDNLGYGYIGVNATFVHELPVRQAIMHAMNINLCVDYYGSESLATPLYRPMSSTLSDYYPEGATSYYPFDASGQTSLRLVQNAGWRDTDSDGILDKNGEKLSFTFTIAGDTDDHPAYTMMQVAAQILNNIGFDVTVTRDPAALTKLSNGQLEVWAAAWSSSSDPDMYQVYHKDSKATSVLNWGYSYIESDGTALENEILELLAAKIEEGRETTDKAKRKVAYSVSSDPTPGTAFEEKCALDLVMELAVELPTYQRTACYVFQKGLFDDETVAMFKNESTAYQSPLSQIWRVSFAQQD